MKKIALLTNYSKDKNLFYTRMIKDYVIRKGCECWLPERISDDGEDSYDLGEMPDDADCAIVLGGDGTLLQAARKLYEKRIPVMGVNIGTLGFLTSAEKDELPGCLDSLFDGRYFIDERMMLTGTAYHDGNESMSNVALNDVIINRAGFSRLVELKIYVNGDLLNIYDADGVIISTSTGSTGYNLSAGGPVVFPESDVMVITPICPHSLQARSIVVPGDYRVTVEIGKRRKSQKEEAIVTYDGQVAKELESGDTVEVCRSQETARLIRLENKSFYQVFQNKIGNV